MRQVRMCLVGGGRAGMVHGGNFPRLPGVSLVAVVDSVEAVRVRAAQELNVAAQFANLEEALERGDFDAVCIATPTHTHHALTFAAARAGRHIFCEKLMAVVEEEALQMVAAIERAGVIFQIGFMRRFDEEFVCAKELVDSGALGRLMTVHATTRGPGLPPSWAWDGAKSGGLGGGEQPRLRRGPVAHRPGVCPRLHACSHEEGGRRAAPASHVLRRGGGGI